MPAKGLREAVERHAGSSISSRRSAFAFCGARVAAEASPGEVLVSRTVK
jgi:hypothetical protein